MGSTAVAAGTQIVAGFFDASWEYNVANFVVGTLGFVIGVLGLSVAIFQIMKTRRAAEAAAAAAKDAARSVGAITTLIDVNWLCSVSSQVILLIRERNLAAAALRAQDLRSGIAQIRASKSGGDLLSANDWQAMVTDVKSVQEVLEKHRTATAAKSADTDRCLAAICDVDEQLHGLASGAARQTGG